MTAGHPGNEELVEGSAPVPPQRDPRSQDEPRRRAMPSVGADSAVRRPAPRRAATGSTPGGTPDQAPAPTFDDILAAARTAEAEPTVVAPAATPQRANG